MKNWTVKQWGTTVAVVGILGFGAYVLAPKPLEVDMGKVEKGPLTMTVHDEGETRVKELYVLSAPVAGRLLRINAKEGDEVVAGQTVIATLMPAEPGFIDTRLREQAQADVRAVEAELALANAERDRAQTLFTNGTVAKAFLDRAQMVQATASAKLVAAKARLISPGSGTVRKIEGGVIELRAPVSGRILGRPQVSETVVQAGQPIVEVGDPAAIEVQGRFLSTDAVKVKPGARAKIVNWGGAPIEASVRVVEPKGFLKVSALGIEEQRVYIILDMPAGAAQKAGLGHGYRVEADIEVASKPNAIKVPVSAIFRDGDQWAAWKDANGTATLVHLKLGAMNSDFAEVTAGLKAGDRVIEHPSDKVADGVRIKPRD